MFNVKDIEIKNIDHLGIVAGDGDIPIFLKAASGNQADSTCFGAIAVEYQNQIKLDSLIVADCAIYTEQNLRWIFECFQSIYLVTYHQGQDVSNLTAERNFLLTFLPDSCRHYYNCVT